MSEHVSGVIDLTKHPARDLARLSEVSDQLDAVRRDDVSAGDRLVVATRNSIYALTARPDGRFLVAGGWFDRWGDGPVEMALAGCTVGGSALLGEVVAAPGLFLEFANGVRTTRIRHVRHFRAAG